MTRRIAFAAAAALLALTGCASKKQPSAAPSVDTVVSPTAAATPAATATGKSTPTSTPSKSSAPTGPTILYFRVKTKPSCPSSGPGVSYPGNDVELEWSAVNVTNVTMSIDSPGLFGTYDATYTHSFPFACGSTPGIYKHKYTLKTVGGGSVKEQTLTVEARQT